MSTTRFNLNIVEAGGRLQAARTTAGPAGDTGAAAKWNSALLTRYQNRAIRDFLREYLSESGPKKFAQDIPEYIKTSAALTLTNGTTYGSVAKPSDCLHVLELSKSDRSVKFFPVPQDEIESVRTGTNGNIVPSASRPVFWEEAGNIYTMGIVSGDVIARYIVTHQDITVVTAAVDDGHKYTTAANVAYVAATQTLTITDSLPAGGWVAADANREIIFYTSMIVYKGKIVSATPAVTPAEHIDIVIEGDGIPAGNLAAPNILGVFTPNISGSDASDLKLDPSWYGQIVDRMVAFARADAKAGLV